MTRRAALALALSTGLASMGMQGGAEVIPRPPRDPDPEPPTLTRHNPDRERGPRSNERRKPNRRTLKKRKAKMARSSRRANQRRK